MLIYYVRISVSVVTGYVLRKRGSVTSGPDVCGNTHLPVI